MNYESEKVFVCGGGHQGLSMAAHLSLNGVEVTLWNRTYENIRKVIETQTIECEGIISGKAHIHKVSTDIGEVVSDFVMVSTPSSAHKDIAKALAPYVHKDMVIILNPGRTFGAVEFAETLVQEGVKDLPHIAETQTIVYTCRRSAENSATIFAMKNDVKIAAIKGADIEYIMEKMPKCLKPYFQIEQSVASTSLANVGMILHCAPVLMNAGWIESKKTEFKYYYEGISKSIADFLERIDKERVHIAKTAGYDVESVSQWMKRSYNVEGDSLHECIINNIAYKEIDAPPTLKCRYIEEDVPNGLVPVEMLGKQLGVSTTNISLVIDLANAVMNCDYRKTGRTFEKEILEKYI